MIKAGVSESEGMEFHYVMFCPTCHEDAWVERPTQRLLCGKCNQSFVLADFKVVSDGKGNELYRVLSSD